MSQGNNDKDEILRRINFKNYYEKHIGKLEANSKGEGKALCPFHEEKTPSFNVNLKNGLWHCFGCDAGGDVFDFTGRINQLDSQRDFPEILRLLKKETGIQEINSLKPRGRRLA